MRFLIFFTEYTYISEQNKELPCYKVTKKGCEFIAHKLTGTKGTEFTARYINRFHDMEEQLAEVEEEQVQKIQQVQQSQNTLAQALLEATKLLEEKEERIKELEQRRKPEILTSRLTVTEVREGIINEVNKISNPWILRQLLTTAKLMQR